MPGVCEWLLLQRQSQWRHALHDGCMQRTQLEQSPVAPGKLQPSTGADGGCEPLITFCLARAQTVANYAALPSPRSPFAMGTRRCRPLRAQTRLSGLAETLKTTARDRYLGARRA